MGGQQQQQQQQHQTDTEEAAEFVATVRGEHVAMKEWFNTTAAAAPNDEVAELARRHGSYPSLWKEVLNWPGWKEARRAYLRHLQRIERGAAAAASGGQSQEQQQQQQQTTTGTQQQPSSEGGAADGGGTRRKRKSRWGTATNDDDNHKRPFIPPQQQAAHTTAAAGASAGGGILNISADSLTPHQQEELRKMQAQLRVVNERMENLEAKAERIDALPRGHRERSPSPPPSTFLFLYFVLFFCWHGVSPSLSLYLCILSAHPAIFFWSNLFFSFSMVLCCHSLRTRWQTPQYTCRALA
jgi:hypothetical protein